MAINQALLPEFDQEMAGVRKTLERIPEDKFSFKPHEKSMTLGRLASHIAELPGWGATTINTNELDIMPGGVVQQANNLATRAEVLALFEKNASEARAAIAGTSDDHLMKPWSLLMNGRVIMTLPRIAVLRNFVMNHVIHHRAQLGVYLRLNNIAVPSLYGPSADEGQMGAGA
jgi:uncharacterized damage-inducible protein DinB